MKKLLLLSFLVLNSSLLVAQPWGALKQGEMTIGGAGDEQGNSIVQTTDGGFAVAGTSNYTVYVIKFDYQGNIQWAKNIGKNTEEGYSIVQTSDSGFAIAGTSSSYSPFHAPNIYVIKLNSSGSILWTRTIETAGGEANYGYSIVQAKDGGYVISGSYSMSTWPPKMYMVKLDVNGNIKWGCGLGGGPAEVDRGSSAILTSDGGYSIAGTILDQFGLIKLDTAGNMQWGKIITDKTVSSATSVIQCKDKGYAMTGNTYQSPPVGPNFNQDVYVVRLDSAGNMKWSRTIGGDSDDEGNSIIQTKDGGFVVAGFTNSFGAGGYDVYVIKLDSAGNLLWTKTFGGKGNDYANSIAQTIDGGFAIAGYTNSYGAGGNDVYLLKIDSLGNICTTMGSGGSITTIDSGKVSASGGFIIGGANTTSVDSGKESSVVVNDSDLCIVLSVNNVSTPKNGITVYPNPSNGKFTFQSSVVNVQSTVEVYNVLGQQVYAQLSIPNSPFSIDLENQPNGIYFYRVLSNGKFLGSGKLVIQ